jgi:hypothetical protein
MKTLTRLFAPIAFVLLLGGTAVKVESVALVPKTAQSQTEKKEVKVWVNTKSGVYHCPGTRWYGATKQGKYMGECEAIKEGDRPAYGKPCGSECK